MNVIEGQDVCVAEPFPLQQLPQAVQWTYCYKTMVFGDHGPKDNEEIGAFLRTTIEHPSVRSWAIIDKNNLTHVKDALPIVGLVFFERSNPQNGYYNIVTHRRAWNNLVEVEGTRNLFSNANHTIVASSTELPGLAEQAGQLVLGELFKDMDLHRVSMALTSNNKSARNFAIRLGFKRDGYFVNMLNIKGKPANLIHMGLLRQEG